MIFTWVSINNFILRRFQLCHSYDSNIITIYVIAASKEPAH